MPEAPATSMPRSGPGTPAPSPARRRRARFRINPITRKRWRRFREMRRGWWSFCLLLGLYGMSLFSELIANDRPLYLRFHGRSYLPVFRYYPENTFTGSGRMTRPDYKAIARSPAFLADPAHAVVWPPVPYGPLEIANAADLAVATETRVVFSPEPAVGALYLDASGTVVRALSAGRLFGTNDAAVAGLPLSGTWRLTPAIEEALRGRLANRAMPGVELRIRSRDGAGALFRLSPYRPRPAPPRTVRVTVTEDLGEGAKPVTMVYDPRARALRGDQALWSQLPEQERKAVLDAAARRADGPVADRERTVAGHPYRVRFEHEDVRFPMRPLPGHPLGIDSAGRDLLARILYGLRTSMTFGLVLVAAAMVLGTLIGAVQGFYGGAVDLVGQRLIEIWQSLPFLYVLILLGSVYGRSFLLLLVVYGVFNWIGISYYMRAEFLRLRRQTFVEAARCLGIPPRRLMFRHILPNGLVPLITFFPFSLVGAIGVLAALDYLGFGLPPPTPSWGELLSQAQSFPWAWWLVLYPSLALFLVMLLGVFIGEAIRNAFDPRRYSRME